MTKMQEMNAGQHKEECKGIALGKFVHPYVNSQTWGNVALIIMVGASNLCSEAVLPCIHKTIRTLRVQLLF